MFSDAVLDHFRNPHNAGDLPDATATVEVTNPVCGDVLRLAVRLESGRIAAARFKTQGCVAAIASSSVLTPASFHAAQLCTDVVAALVRKL